MTEFELTEHRQNLEHAIDQADAWKGSLMPEAWPEHDANVAVMRTSLKALVDEVFAAKAVILGYRTSHVALYLKNCEEPTTAGLNAFVGDIS